MAGKLGLKEFAPDTDEALVEDLLENLQLTETDMTIFFRLLASVTADTDQTAAIDRLMPAFYVPEELVGETRDSISNWLQRYQQRTGQDDLPAEVRKQNMNAVNPKYVLRNYMAQLAIDKSNEGDHSLIAELLELLRHPYDEQPESEEAYFRKRPEWARSRAGCSMLSCSS